MDEFFKVRVASIHRRMEMGKGMAEVLEIIGDKTRGWTSGSGRPTRKSFRAGRGHQTPDRGRPRKPIGPVNGMGHGLLLHERDAVCGPILVRDGQPFPTLKDGAVYFAVKMWAKRPATPFSKFRRRPRVSSNCRTATSCMSTTSFGSRSTGSFTFSSTSASRPSSLRYRATRNWTSTTISPRATCARWSAC